jgi:hypothetical protein
MTFFPDLGFETQIAGGDHVRAIGWLHPDHPMPSGEVSAEVLERIRQFSERCDQSADALMWPVAGGVHTCEFCGGSAAGGNFAVPNGGILYVAPELLWHYVAMHRYLPPAEFQRALLASPLPGTTEYELAVSHFVAM